MEKNFTNLGAREENINSSNDTIFWDNKNPDELLEIAGKNPAKFDDILILLARKVKGEMQTLSDEGKEDDREVNQENMKILLGKVSEESIEKLSKLFEIANENNKRDGNIEDKDRNFNISKNGVEVSISNIDKCIYLKINLSGSNEKAKYVIDTESPDNKNEFKITILHRITHPNSQKDSIEEWLDKVVEYAAKRAGIKVLNFQSNDSFENIEYPLNNGYIYDTLDGKKWASEILKKIYDNPSGYKKSRDSKIYTLKKQLFS